MGKIDIDCRDGKGTIIIGLAGQLDTYNSINLSCLIDAYIESGFKKFVINPYIFSGHKHCSGTHYALHVTVVSCFDIVNIRKFFS